MADPAPVRYRAADLESWTAAVFRAAGTTDADAGTIARALVRSDLRGYRTHGLTRVASYVQRFAEGEFNPRPRIDVQTREGTIVVDADGALGHVAAPVAQAAAQAQLAARGQVFVAVRECGHLGALGLHALAAAEHGMFCILGQRTPPLLAMEGFTEPGIGHNPIAFGCPVAGRDPLVFDIACSVAARGHILLAAREGRPIPAGWAVDRHGRPTTDAREAADGMLLPAGGHKGVGIAMMVECLAGAFTATADSLERFVARVPAAGAVGRQGAFFWFLDPGGFAGRAVFDAYTARWTGIYEGAGGRLPGTRGARLERAGRADGLALAPDIERELRALGERLGIPFPPAPAA
ncbi:MAG: Ldh family oxidoreductase [Burkholderiales bacterium]|nr:Ldh family oxidoreductase [Burkholderiales bacterium]